MMLSLLNNSCAHKSFIYTYILHLQINDSRCNSSLELAVPEDCGNIRLNRVWYGTGNTVRGYAEFAVSTLKGNITFVSRITTLLNFHITVHGLVHNR